MAAALVGLVALGCYCATLLPGLDFGDTASFQTGVGSIVLTPRQAYPLYYAIGNVFAWLDPHEPAHALNLASAVYGAIAAALATWVAIEIAGSLVGGLAAGLFLAFSYTFWTQAIIAEVYTLHLLIIGVCLAALLAWARRPSLPRLALFYAVFALGFGNHLSTVLLLPGFTVFILLNRAKGADDPVRPKAIAMALGIAALGSLQYLWNFAGLWSTTTPPASLAAAIGQFWFDVTKSDWRETLVMSVSDTGLHNRPAMYWFDLHQQFGTPGAILAVAGIVVTFVRRPRIGVLLALLYLVNLIFAWTYNVGDVHVFFLPSHYIVALWAGAGVAALIDLPIAGSVRVRQLTGVAVALCLLYPIWRGYDTFPAVDRSWDRRPERLLEQFTAPAVSLPVEEPDSIFGVDSNWQVQNGVEYYMREQRPAAAWFTSDELEWLKGPDPAAHFQRFVDDNWRCCRRTVMATPMLAKRLITLGYGTPPRDGASILVDTSAPSLATEIGRLAPGTAYALAVLTPYREFPIDRQELNDSYRAATGATTPLPAFGAYTIVVGTIGSAPSLIETRDRPFRTSAAVDGMAFDIRMESWLPTDTIRRAGFGHVIVDRRHVLTMDRGISFVAIGGTDRPDQVAYRSGLFAPLTRFVIGSPARAP